MQNQIIIITLIIICLAVYYYYQNNQDNSLVKNLKQQVQHYQSLIKEKKTSSTQTDSLGIDKESQTNLPDPELETKLNFLNKSFENLQKDNKLKDNEIKQLQSQYNDEKLPILKAELFNSFKEVYQALKLAFEAAYFMKGKDAIKEKLTELDNLINHD